jgi:hypothetical protein
MCAVCIPEGFAGRVLCVPDGPAERAGGALESPRSLHAIPHQPSAVSNMQYAPCFMSMVPCGCAASSNICQSRRVTSFFILALRRDYTAYMGRMRMEHSGRLALRIWLVKMQYISGDIWRTILATATAVVRVESDRFPMFSAF